MSCIHTAIGNRDEKWQINKFRNAFCIQTTFGNRDEKY